MLNYMDYYMCSTTSAGMSFFIITRNYAAYMCLFVCVKKYKYINALLRGSQGTTSDMILQKPPTLLFV